MGYRNYIGFIPKREYNKIKKLSREEIYQLRGEDLEDGYVGIYDLVSELYGFGKYCDFETKGLVKPFFKNKEFQKSIDGDHEFYTVQKEFLEKVIDNYTEKVKTYYNEMIKPFLGSNGYSSEFINSIKRDYNYDKTHYTLDFSKITKEEQTSLVEIIEHVRSMRNEWVSPYLKPYDLNKGDEITTSWKYEYGIFELVRIYKTFDWKKNVMVYYGW
jgi:hypothetical protein